MSNESGTTAQFMWTLEGAAAAIRELHTGAMLNGFNLHLGGGVLMNGGSFYDVDVIAVPRIDRPYHVGNMVKFVEGLGWKTQRTFTKPNRWISSFEREGQVMELIFLTLQERFHIPDPTFIDEGPHPLPVRCGNTTQHVDCRGTAIHSKSE